MALVEATPTERDTTMRQIADAVSGLPFTSATYVDGGVNIVRKDVSMNDVFFRVTIQRDGNALKDYYQRGGGK